MGNFLRDFAKAFLAVGFRKDVVGTLASNDGDPAPLQFNSQGALRVDASVTVETVQQGAPNTGANGWPVVAVENGTNTLVFTGNSAQNSQNVTIAGGPAVSSLHAGATISVGSGAAVSLLASNASRKGFMLVNNSATDCYVGLESGVVSGASAAAHGGLLLKSNGGGISMGALDGWTGVVYAITNAGTAIVGVQEW